MYINSTAFYVILKFTIFPKYYIFVGIPIGTRSSNLVIYDAVFDYTNKEIMYSFSF